jgi:hypothetical protein
MKLTDRETDLTIVRAIVKDMHVTVHEPTVERVTDYIRDHNLIDVMDFHTLDLVAVHLYTFAAPKE